jgi:hypothetical protein
MLVRIPDPAIRAGEDRRGGAGPVNASIELSSIELSRRDRAILRAVAGAVLLVGVEPDLYLDGRCCADQVAARRLARAGLIAAATPGRTAQRVAARLTSAGRRHAVSA